MYAKKTSREARSGVDGKKAERREKEGEGRVNIYWELGDVSSRPPGLNII
jgi:hypothetical protein